MVPWSDWRLLHPDGVQRHNGEWRVTPLDDPESNLRDLKEAPALTTECEWRTPGCKTCQDVRHHKGWHSAEREFSLQRYLTRCGRLRRRKDFWTLVQTMHAETTRRSDAKIMQRRWYRNPPLVLVSNIEDSPSCRRRGRESTEACTIARRTTSSQTSVSDA